MKQGPVWVSSRDLRFYAAVWLSLDSFEHLIEVMGEAACDCLSLRASPNGNPLNVGA
jgi:hypothetical protein